MGGTSKCSQLTSLLRGPTQPAKEERAVPRKLLEDRGEFQRSRFFIYRAIIQNYVIIDAHVHASIITIEKSNRIRIVKGIGFCHFKTT